VPSVTSFYRRHLCVWYKTTNSEHLGQWH